MVWLARIALHYRQEIPKESAAVYRELLTDLSSAELDAAFRLAVKTSEFMPTVATIRKAVRDLQQQNHATAIHYPEVPLEDRTLSDDEEAKLAQMKAKIFAIDGPKRPIFTKQDIEQQKEELRRRGMLK